MYKYAKVVILEKRLSQSVIPVLYRNLSCIQMFKTTRFREKPGMTTWE